MAETKSCIGGKRMCGKTSELIKRSNKEQLYILCANRHTAIAIFEQAKNIKLNIPFPIIVDELPLISTSINSVLVDEIEKI